MLFGEVQLESELHLALANPERRLGGGQGHLEPPREGEEVQDLGLGLAGSVLLILGSLELILALLRALQTESGSSFTGNLSWLPYLITVVVTTVVAGILAMQINKRSLR